MLEASRWGQTALALGLVSMDIDDGAAGLGFGTLNLAFGATGSALRLSPMKPL